MVLQVQPINNVIQMYLQVVLPT